MKFAMLLPVVACLLTVQRAFAQEGSPAVLMNGDMCFDETNSGGKLCQTGSYCPTMMGPSARCQPLCDRCFLQPAMHEENYNMPAQQQYCQPGYTRTYPPEGSQPLCNVCDKGYFSESTNDGKGNYVEGTTMFPGNMGCMKCPPGHVTMGVGMGTNSSSCFVPGQLPADWQTQLFAEYPDAMNCTNAADAAINVISQAQDALLSASTATLTAEEEKRMTQQNFESMSMSAMGMSNSMMQVQNVLMKFSQLFDRNTGRVTCMTDDDCGDLSQAFYANGPMGGNQGNTGPNPDMAYSTNPNPNTGNSTDPNPNTGNTGNFGYGMKIACIKERETDMKGTCIEAAGLQGNNGPLPDCNLECTEGCVTVEAASLNMTSDAWKNQNRNGLSANLCNCLTSCSIDTCDTPSDRAKISHLNRDICGKKDPYYVEPAPVPAPVSTPVPAPVPAPGPAGGFTGGNDVQCGLGQFVLNKNVPDMEVCMDCPAGRFAKARTTRNRECKKCPRGWIQPQGKQGRCEKCPPGETSNMNRTVCETMIQ